MFFFLLTPCGYCVFSHSFFFLFFKQNSVRFMIKTRKNNGSHSLIIALITKNFYQIASRHECVVNLVVMLMAFGVF